MLFVKAKCGGNAVLVVYRDASHEVQEATVQPCDTFELPAGSTYIRHGELGLIPDKGVEYTQGGADAADANTSADANDANSQ